MIIKNNKSTIFFKKSKDLNKTPILFLHGFGANSSHWRNNAEPFSQAGFRVYGLDLVGFGESDQPSRKRIPKLDNHFWAEQVIAFIEQIIQTSKKEKVILIWSFFSKNF